LEIRLIRGVMMRRGIEVVKERLRIRLGLLLSMLLTFTDLMGQVRWGAVNSIRRVLRVVM
jgi:hypothetical protein